MDSSSKKVVMFIFAVALGIIAVMAFNDYNRPTVENPTPVAAPEPAPVMAEPSAAPIQTSSPAGTFSAREDIPAINGEPSMKLDSYDNNENADSNSGEQMPTDNGQ